MLKIKSELNKGIAKIIFSDPKANCLTSDSLKKLISEISKFGKSEEVAVILLQSEGEGAFCAGASFEELEKISSLAESIAFFKQFGELILSIKNSEKLILTRVQGKVVGGGVGIVAASDYVIASQSAAVKLSEFAIGLGPFAISPAIERKIGIAGLSELAIDCEWKDSSWCLQKGLFSCVCSSIEILDLKIAEFAKLLSERSPSASSQLKRALWSNTEDWQILLNERAEISGRLWFERQGGKLDALS
jgi:methylglutaconyl-CoA hydratase